MLNFDYKLHPGQKLETLDFEIDNNQKPIVSIITPYYNGQKYIEETANCILNQTFPYWEWIIIDDGSNEKDAIEKLKQIEKMDKRIKVLHKENGGVASARDFGVQNSNKETKYLMFLDSDDVVNKTYIECAYWTLETNPDASWTYTDVANFYGKEFLWRKWYNPNWEQDENILVVTAFLKREAFEEVGGFDLKEKKVYEDWCFWLKLIKNGRFPVRMSSLLTWYRIKSQDESELLQSRNENEKRALKLVENIKRDIVYTEDGIQYPHAGYNWEEILDKQENIVQIKRKKNDKINILLIIPWMVTGGADKFNLDLIERSNKNKYEYTVVSTIPSDNPWRQDFEKYATVYDLTTFLDRKNWPSFLNYLIEKNNINIIFNTNSQYGYNALPYLKARYPEIPIIDYVHMEEWYDRNGGFSRDSSQYESILDKTYTCNANSKNIFEKHFHRNEEDVETMYIGVDEKKFNPELYDKQQILKEFNIDLKDRLAIGFICRLAEQKRPMLLIEIIKELKKIRNDFVVLIAGDGPFKKDMQRKIEKYNLTENFIFLGNIKETERFYKICDLTLNCSIKEGLALTAYESLSMGVPVISSDVGGQKELINEEVGVIVPCIQDETDIRDFNYSKEEISNYVNGIQKIFSNLEKYKSNCRNRILNGFTIDNMVKNMNKAFDKIASNPRKDKVENGEKLKANIAITKELLCKFILQSELEYEWASKMFNTENIHMMTKYDKKAKKEQFYEQTMEYKIKHPIVIILKKVGLYDTLKRLIGWEKK